MKRVLMIIAVLIFACGSLFVQAELGGSSRLSPRNMTRIF